MADEESRWRKAAEGLKAIAGFKVDPDDYPRKRDADKVVAVVEGLSAPTSVGDLSLKLNDWDPDRLAQALTFAVERGRLAFTQFKDQTFVGLPTTPR